MMIVMKIYMNEKRILWGEKMHEQLLTFKEIVENLQYLFGLNTESEEVFSENEIKCFITSIYRGIL